MKLMEYNNYFDKLFLKYTSDTDLILKLKSELIEAYTHVNRHYHNIKHIETLFDLAHKYQHLITDFDLLLFSILYHDIVYFVSNFDNEEESASLCASRLKTLGLEQTKIKKSYEMILATKTHHLSDSVNNFDAQFFLDIDLSVLGSNPDTYDIYATQIRKEYSIYPDSVYNKGRIKIVENILSTQIFKTNIFNNELEKQARENINREINSLKNNLP